MSSWEDSWAWAECWWASLGVLVGLGGVLVGFFVVAGLVVLGGGVVGLGGFFVVGGCGAVSFVCHGNLL